MTALLLAFLALAQEDPARLVERFSSDSAAERDEATRKLLKLGDGAVPALDAGTRSKDPETAARSARLLKILANRKLLTPRIRAAFPGVVEDLDSRDADAWTRLFLEASRTEGNLPAYRSLVNSDLVPLIGQAVRGIRTLEDKQAFCSAVHMWKLAEAAPYTGPLLKGEDDQNLWYSVPALLAMIEPKSAVASLEPVLTDPSPKVRARAVDLLHKFRDRASLQAAFRALKDGDRDVRATALKVLSANPHPEAVPEILPLLEDPNLGIRGGAVEALANSGGKDAVPHLLKMLGDPEGYIRARALTGLTGRVPPESVPRILPLFQDAHQEVRRSAMGALVSLKGKEAVPQILPLLADPWDQVRYDAVNHLSAMKCREHAAKIAELLGDPDEIVRGAAVLALGELGALEQAPKIIELLRCGSDSVRADAIQAVVTLKLRAATPDLVELLKHDEDYIRRDAFAALDKFDAVEAVPYALKILQEPSDTSHELAQKFLVRTKDPRFIPTLLGLLEHEETRVQEIAIELLPKIGGKELIPKFLAMLESPKEAVRAAGERIVSRLDNDDAVPHLVKLLRHENAEVRLQAVDSLRFRAEDELFEEARRLLADPAPAVRVEVLHCLDLDERPEALPLVLPNLDHEDAAVRAAAVKSLSLAKSSAEVGNRLLPLVKDPDTLVRREVFQAAFQQQDKRFLAAAVGAMEDGDYLVRAAASNLLGSVGDDKTLDQVVPLLDSPHVDVRRSAFFLVGHRSAEKLLKGLEDEDQGIRMTARYHLARLQRPEILPILLEDLKDGLQRPNAILNLGATGNSKAIPLLMEVFVSGGADDRAACMGAFAELKAQEAVPLLLKALKEGDLPDNAAGALAKMEVRAAVPLLLDRIFFDKERNGGTYSGALAQYPVEATQPVFLAALKNPDPTARSRGLTALRILKRTSAAADIRALLADPELSLRVQAVEAAFEMDDREAIPALVGLLSDPASPVATGAMGVLAGFGAKVAAPKLRQIVDEGPESVRPAAIRTLGRLGGREDVARIVPFLKHPDAEMRDAAVHALGSLDARESWEGILAVLKRDNSEDAGRILARWGVKEAIPDLQRLLVDERQYSERIAEFLCMLGSTDGVRVLLQGRDRLFALNAIRSPEVWKRLRDIPAPKVGKIVSRATLLEAYGRQAGLKISVPKGWGDWDVGGDRDGSLLDALESLEGYDLSIVLEGDSLRFLQGKQGSRFWKSWWRERQDKR